MFVKRVLTHLTGNNLLLALLIIFFLAANTVWIHENQAPPMWDQSHYLLHSDLLYHTLTKEGIIPFAEAFTGAIKTKAPLIAVLPIPFYLLFGDSEASALCVNLAFIVLGCYYLYKLASLVAGPKEGLMSVFIVNTFPLVFAMSREFLVEYGLMVFVVMWMYYFLKSDCFFDSKYKYVLGIVFGLGMLMKITFILYIIFPTLFLFIARIIKDKKIFSFSFKNLFTVLFVGILIAGPWYFVNLRHILGFALTSGFSNIARNYGMGDVFSIRTVLSYWWYIVIFGISAYYFLLIIFIIIRKLFYYMQKEHFANVDREYIVFLSIWFFVPFIVFTFGVNKDYRYTAPLYPALAILMSVSLARMSSKFYGRILLFILLLFPAMSYLFISFSTKSVTLNMGQFAVPFNYLAYAHAPGKEQWPYEKLIKVIQQDASRTNNSTALTTLLCDHEHMNQITSSYYAENSNLNIRFQTCDYFSGETTEEVAAGIEQNSDYLVVKSDKLGPDFSNVKNKAVMSLLKQGKLNFKRLIAFQLPDQTLLTVYKRRLDNYVFSGIDKTRDYQINTHNPINFSGKIALLDFKIRKEKNEDKLIFFWECLDDMDLNYKIFVHVEDEHDRPVLYADHYPVNGRYPSYNWRKGEVIKDEVNIVGHLPSNSHIYIGAYNEIDGSRLVVRNASAGDKTNINEVKIY